MVHCDLIFKGGLFILHKENDFAKKKLFVQAKFRISDLQLYHLNISRNSTIASVPGTSVMIPLNGLDRSSVV